MVFKQLTPHKRRILILASNTQSLLNFRRELLQSWLQAGMEVIAVAPHQDTTSVQALESMGISFVYLPFANTGLNPFVDAILIFKFFRLMKRYQPDQVFAYTVKPIVYGFLAAKLARVKKRYAMVTGLGTAFEEEASLFRRMLKKGVSFLYLLSLRGCIKVFFQNHDDSAYFLQKKMVKTNQVVQIAGSGVNLTHYQKVPLPETLSFLMIARLVRAKGVYEYAEAARRLCKQYPFVVCHLVGPLVLDHPDSINPADLDNWVKEGVLQYHGEQLDVRSFISQTAVCVLPSYREGTPRSVLEAMAMGRAVITTDVPGCRETVIPGVTGFLVQKKDVQSLVEAMRQFITDPDLPNKMGLLGYEHVKKTYDVNLVNSCILFHMGLEGSTPNKILEVSINE